MLGEDIAAALPELRRHAESLMTDTIRLEALTGGTVQDPVTLEETPEYAEVYEGPGRVQRPDTNANEQVVGGAEFGVNRATVQLPISVIVAKRGQRVTVVASVSDPALAGSVFTVVGIPAKTHATMRRLLCEEVT